MILRVSVLTALATTICAVLLWAGVLPTAARWSGHSGRPRGAAACPQCEACPRPSEAAATPPVTPAPAVAPQLSAVTTQSSALDPAARPATREPLRRFTICDAPRGEPRVRLLSISDGAPAIGVHCGTSAHLIAFDHGEPRRIARVDIESSGTPAARSGEGTWVDRAGDLLATDVNGDGRTDLLVGTVREDDRGSPRGGVLSLSLRAASGSFDAPRSLAPIAVGRLAASELDGAPGSDLTILRVEDSRLPRANELVVLRGGPAPVKLSTLPAGVGVDQLGAVDLDLDERADLILGARARGAEIVLMGDAGRSKQRIPLAGIDVSGIAIADLNGDGHDDALLAGPNAGVVLANATTPGTLRSIPALQGLDSMQTLDWNGDGKLDVLGVQGQTLVALVQKGDLEFDSQSITQWPDADFRLLTALAGRTYGGPLGLVLIASPVRAHGRVELLLASEVPADAVSVQTESLPDAPLRQQLSLP